MKNKKSPGVMTTPREKGNDNDTDNNKYLPSAYPFNAMHHHRNRLTCVLV